MTRKKKYQENKFPSRKLFFERPYGIKLERLLEIYLDVIGNIDAEVDMKIDKISFTLSASKDELERVVNELQSLQGQLINATVSDSESFFRYEQGLFKHIFKHQVQTKFLHQLLLTNGYKSEFTEDKTIISDATIDELGQLQELGYQSLRVSPHDLHRDIQKFLSIVHLKTEKTHDEVLQLALANNLLFEKEGIIHFSGDPDLIFDQIFEIITDLSAAEYPTDLSSSKEIDEDLSSFGFDGGKIVFVNASDRSTYEDQENLEKRKEIENHETDGH